MGEARILYPLFYAAMLLISTVVIVIAQLQRKQNEGIAINYQILKVLVITNVLTWVGTVGFYLSLGG